MDGRPRGICAGAVVVLTCAVVGCGLRAQAITARWQPLILAPVPIKGIEKEVWPIVVVEGGKRSARLRWTIDNPCGDDVRLNFREGPIMTLALERAPGNWQISRVCPAAVVLQSYAAKISRLSPGRWHVTGATLGGPAVPDFDVR